MSGSIPCLIAAVEDEGLERGAGLAVRLPGVVELRFGGVAFGRGEGDDRAGLRVDRGEAGGRAAFRVTDVARVLDRFFGLRLQVGVDRRVGLEAAVADGVDPVAVDQLLLDQVEEERGRGSPGTCRRGRGRGRWSIASLYSLRRDVALLVHRSQHLVAALQSPPSGRGRGCIRRAPAAGRRSAPPRSGRGPWPAC